MTHTDNKSLVEAVKNAWSTLWVEDGQHDRCLPPNPYVVLLQDLLPEQSICKLAEAAIAALQNQPQVDNKSLVELLNKLEQEAFNFGFARATGRYWHHHADNVDKYKAAIAALQNQQPNVQPTNTDKTSVQKPQGNERSVNQQMLKALKFYADEGNYKSRHGDELDRQVLDDWGSIAKQAIANAESSKPKERNS